MTRTTFLWCGAEAVPPRCRSARATSAARTCPRGGAVSRRRTTRATSTRLMVALGVRRHGPLHGEGRAVATTASLGWVVRAARARSRSSAARPTATPSRRRRASSKRASSVGIFPEGTRHHAPGLDGLEEGAGGTAFIALRAGVPVVPVGIDGTERIMPEGSARSAVPAADHRVRRRRSTPRTSRRAAPRARRRDDGAHHGGDRVGDGRGRREERVASMRVRGRTIRGRLLRRRARAEARRGGRRRRASRAHPRAAHPQPAGRRGAARARRRGRGVPRGGRRRDARHPHPRRGPRDHRGRRATRGSTSSTPRARS